MPLWLFVFLGVLAVLSALGVILQRNPVHCLLALAINLLDVGVIFIGLGAVTVVIAAGVLGCASHKGATNAKGGSGEVADAGAHQLSQRRGQPVLPTRARVVDRPRPAVEQAAINSKLNFQFISGPPR